MLPQAMRASARSRHKKAPCPPAAGGNSAVQQPALCRAAGTMSLSSRSPTYRVPPRSQGDASIIFWKNPGPGLVTPQSSEVAIMSAGRPRLAGCRPRGRSGSRDAHAQARIPEPGRHGPGIGCGPFSPNHSGLPSSVRCCVPCRVESRLEDLDGLPVILAARSQYRRPPRIRDAGRPASPPRSRTPGSHPPGIRRCRRPPHRSRQPTYDSAQHALGAVIMARTPADRQARHDHICLYFCSNTACSGARSVIQ